ncbi:putative disease resistance protein RGA3 [Miscanthus floridulus]|uniref:putative disease resistance protein RGA3 n=1 Tax=Miscanthus floridulus TaxID=154761 RepID=UPI00345A201C
MASSSTYVLEGVSLSTDLVPESSFVRQSRLVTEAPLAIMAPPSYAMSGGSSLKITARSKVPQGGAKEKKMTPTQPTIGALGHKRKASDVSRPSKCSVVMPSGITTLPHIAGTMIQATNTRLDEVKIACELLELLHGDRYENVTDFNELLNILGYEMKPKRVLLVMDDMWEDNKKEKWDEFLTPLITNGVNGNMIIVTTRKSSVARMTGATHDINLDGLEPEDFWCLFKECAFGDENHIGHRKLQKIGRKITVKLKGYPLAAKSVGKLLKRKLDDEHWNRVLDNTEWKNQKDDNDIIPALKISYNYIPKHLQRCFLTVLYFQRTIVMMKSG